MERNHRLAITLPWRVANRCRAEAAARNEPTARYLSRLILQMLAFEEANDAHRVH